ncbi:MAG: FlgD immunoglobulin-like domain containing protein [Candidatus Krumholzibacteriia bacterium]
MRTLTTLSICCAALATLLGGEAADATTRAGQTNLIFIHHSIGRTFLDPTAGAMRDTLAALNARNGTRVLLWDHDYGEGHPVWGLSNTVGLNLGYAYGDEFNNTIQTVGYRALFDTANASRDSLLNDQDVIAFKCGYESGWLWLTTDDELALARADYLAMRGFFDQHPDKQFVVVTQPPINCNATYLDGRVDRARQLAVFLGSDEFLAGHPNVHCFDLFDLLARPDDPADPCHNTLRYEYEIDPISSDPHPNEYAGATIGPLFVQFLYNIATTTQSTPVTPPVSMPFAQLAPAWPNPFNPRTTLEFTLGAAAWSRLSVYDLGGRLVKTLVDDHRPAGVYAVAWDGRNGGGRAVAAGIYVARLRAGNELISRRLTLVR